MARHERRFRFAVQASSAAGAQEWSDLAREVESLGYSTLTMPDHFGDRFAPLSALAAAAGVTRSLRIGALVFDNDYRQPVVLAKEAATLDVLSGARLELGLGAGWLTTDYVLPRSLVDGAQLGQTRWAPLTGNEPERLLAAAFTELAGPAPLWPRPTALPWPREPWREPGCALPAPRGP